MRYSGLSSLVTIGPAIVIITPRFVSTLVPAYLGKDILPLELGVILYLIGYFNHFFPIFGFITVIIEIKIVAKLFG